MATKKPTEAIRGRPRKYGRVPGHRLQCTVHPKVNAVITQVAFSRRENIAPRATTGGVVEEAILEWCESHQDEAEEAKKLWISVFGDPEDKSERKARRASAADCALVNNSEPSQSPTSTAVVSR